MEIYLCNNCGRYYQVEPTEYPMEWRVTLITGETVRMMMPNPPTTEAMMNYALTGEVEQEWGVMDWMPVQIQAAPGPLCHSPECASIGELVETYPLPSGSFHRLT